MEHNAGCRYCLGMLEKKAKRENISRNLYAKWHRKRENPAETGNPHLICGVEFKICVLRKDENIGCSVTAATVMWEVQMHIADGKVSVKLKSAAVIVRQTVESPKGFCVRKSSVLMFTSTIISEFRRKISLFDFRRLKSSKQTIKSSGRL